MRSNAPGLLPVLRSPLQGLILAETLLHPARETTLTALAERVGAALSSVHAEVQRLVTARILSERTIGRSRLVRADTSNPVVRPLTELVALTFGPLTAVRDEFGPLPGVERVLLFGSWAARYQGTPGPPPNDVDVLVVGKPSREAVYEAADHVERVVGSPVNPVIVSRRRFAAAGDPFMRQVITSPQVVAVDNTGAP